MTELFLALSGIFIAAGIASFTADRLSIPSETLYIIAGLVLSPLVALPELELLAETGAVFVVFLAAMHLRTDELDAVAMDAFWLSAVQVLLVGGGAVAVAVWAGLTIMEAVLVGMACGLSSSMLGSNLVAVEVDRNLLHGRLTEAVNVMQDIVAILVVGSLPFWPVIGETIGAMAIVAGMVVAALVLGSRLRPLIAYVAEESETGLLFALMVLWAVVAVTEMLPFNTIVAAVVAGTLLSTHPENLDLLTSLEPVKEFFAALFFVVLGMLVAAPSSPALLLAAALIAVIGLVNPLLSMAVLYLRGVSPHDGFRTAFQLDQVSEIVLLLGLGLHVTGSVSDTVFQAVVMAAAVTFVVSSFTTHNVDRFYRRLVHPFVHVTPPVEHGDHVIVAGFGPIGQTVANAVEDPVIVDNDPVVLQQARQEGYETVAGDVRDPGTWRRAAVEAAHMVVLTVPLDDAAKLLSTYGTPFIALTASDDMADRLAEEAVFVRSAAALRRETLIEAVVNELDGWEG